MIKTLFLILLVDRWIFSVASLLTCFSHCSIFSADLRACRNETSVKLCQGRLTVVYQDKAPLTFVNFTFGHQNDSISLDYRNDMEENSLEKLHFYQIFINAEREETTLIVDVFCSHANQCAWIDLNEHLRRYEQQSNPVYHLQSSFSRPRSSTDRLQCFDSNTRQTERCSSASELCLSSLKDLKQECANRSNVFIQEDFLVPSPHTVALDRTTHLVQCNVDRCNSDKMLTKIENITRQYALGLVPRSNSAADERRTRCLLLFIFVQILSLFTFVH